MKRLIPLVILVSVFLPGFSQNGSDALRFSESFAGGTARSIAMGGAFGALGADFSSASLNPAGLGFYRKSEFTFSPDYYFSKVKSDYLGTTKEDNKFNFNNNNLSFVFAHNKKRESGLVGWTFGLGFNKLNNFNSNSFTEGVNGNSSLADYFTNTANNNESLDIFTDGLFYDANIIVWDTVDQQYYVNPDMGLTNIQRKTIEKSGKMNEFLLSAGFNISNVFYFGFSLNMIPVDYKESAALIEYDANDPAYEYFTYYEGKKIKGEGYGAKLGIIVRPITPLRLGLAFHTPVVYKMNSKDVVYVQSRYTNVPFETFYPYDWDLEREYLESEYKYNIETPAKVIGSLAFTISDKAIISSDLEFINYSSMRLSESGDGYNFTDANQEIKDIYKNAFNWKTGAEVRFEPFYVRGGFGYYGSPFKSGEINEDSYSLNYTGGFGYRDKNFFIDLALGYMQRKEALVLYPSVEEDVKFSNNTTHVTTTIGFRF
jgi:hypothetical protein